MLDFETLRRETLDPEPSTGNVKAKRLKTVGRIAELGVSNSLIAKACGVTPPTVRQWRFAETSPTAYTAQVALDRLDPLLDHFADDLGLSDESIGDFLVNERWGSDEDLRLGPCYAGYRVYNMLLIDGLGRYGRILERIEERLKLRFPERQVEAQAGITATPTTIV